MKFLKIVKFGQNYGIWSKLQSCVHLHVGHHVHCNVNHHVGHLNAILTLCKILETLTEWKSTYQRCTPRENYQNLRAQRGKVGFTPMKFGRQLEGRVQIKFWESVFCPDSPHPADFYPCPAPQPFNLAPPRSQKGHPRASLQPTIGLTAVGARDGCASKNHF